MRFILFVLAAARGSDAGVTKETKTELREGLEEILNAWRSYDGQEPNGLLKHRNGFNEGMWGLLSRVRDWNPDRAEVESVLGKTLFDKLQETRMIAYNQHSTFGMPTEPKTIRLASGGKIMQGSVPKPNKKGKAKKTSAIEVQAPPTWKVVHDPQRGVGNCQYVFQTGSAGNALVMKLGATKALRTDVASRCLDEALGFSFPPVSHAHQVRLEQTSTKVFIEKGVLTVKCFGPGTKDLIGQYQTSVERRAALGLQSPTENKHFKEKPQLRPDVDYTATTANRICAEFLKAKEYYADVIENTLSEQSTLDPIPEEKMEESLAHFFRIIDKK
jgi:hypothetical protein